MQKSKMIISKSVTVIFVEFVNQLIDYSIMCASLNHYVWQMLMGKTCCFQPPSIGIDIQAQSCLFQF